MEEAGKQHHQDLERKQKEKADAISMMSAEMEAKVNPYQAKIDKLRQQQGKLEQEMQHQQVETEI